MRMTVARAIRPSHLNYRIENDGTLFFVDEGE
jgi:hypothetical protein